MSFSDSIKSFWRKYTVFQGRARRSEYWFVVLFLFLSVLGVTLVDVIVFTGVVATTGFGPLTTLFLLGTFLPSITLTVRRFHDVGMSGWLVLLGLIPFAGPLFVFIVSLLPSQAASNKFGSAPHSSRDMSAGQASAPPVAPSATPPAATPSSTASPQQANPLPDIPTRPAPRPDPSFWSVAPGDFNEGTGSKQ